MKPEICLITCIGPYNTIGIKDKMPWHSKQDFYHFKKQTKGYPCVFGSTTYYGLPKYPLRDRLNVVVDLNFPNQGINYKDGCLYDHDLQRALKNPILQNYSKIFICGGRSIYKACLDNDLIDTIYLTKIISSSLEKEFSIPNPDYIKFPIEFQDFLKNGWQRDVLSYSEEELPEEESDIVIQFQKWIKK